MVLGVALAAIVLWFLSAKPAVDIHAYYDAAVRLRATGSPYPAVTLKGEWHSGVPGLYVYPPLLAMLLTPITAIGLPTVTALWLLLGLAILVLTCALMPVQPWIKVTMLGVALLSAPFIHNLQFGNVSGIVAFLAVVCWRWLDKPLGSAAIAASLMLRPWLGIIGVWWLVRRQWLAVAWLAAVGLGLVILSAAVMGVKPWQDWITVLRNLGDELGVGPNYDIGSVALRLGASPVVAHLFLVGGYVLAVAAIVVSLRRDRHISFAVTLTATTLLSPLLWVHYLTVLIVPAALMASRGRRLAVFIPLLLWLPMEATPFVIVVVMLLPLTIPDQGPPAATWPTVTREPPTR